MGEIVGVKLREVLSILGAGLAALCLLLSSGCGSKSTANVITVTVTSSNGFSLILGATTTLTATVTGATNINVTWSPLQYTTTTTTNGKTTTSTSTAPNDGSFGVLSNTQPTGTATYTAPDPSKFQLPDQTKYPGLQIVITATSVQDTKKSGKINLTLVSGIRATLKPVAVSVPTKESQQFFAALVNDVQTKGVKWLLTQNIPSTTNGVTTTYPELPTCSPTCGTIAPDTNNPNVAVYTAPDTVPTAITPAQTNNPNSSTPQNVTIVATPNADSSGVVIGTITIVTGGPITFNGITPTIAPQGGASWDIYLDAPNISSASKIVLNYQDGANPPNIIGTKTFDSTSGQIKILFPLPASSTSSTTTTTTSPASTGARLRLLEKDLGQPPPGTQSVLVTVIDPAEPVCPPTCTPPATAPPPSAFTFTFVPVRPTSIASVPDDVVQGKLSQQTRVIIDGGYFGPNGTLAAPSFQGNVIVQDQNHPSTSRQLNTLMSTLQINQGNPGLYPLTVASTANPPPSANNPSVTNMAIFPDYSTTPPAVLVSGIPAGTNPSALDIDPTIGVAVVAEAGAPATSSAAAVPSAVQFYAIGKGTLTPIDSTGASCITSCPVTSQSFPGVSLNMPTGVSVNRTNHTVAVVNYGDQSVTVLPIPVPGASPQNPAPGTPFTVDISGALQNSVKPAPIAYSIGVDPDSNLALVAYSATSVSTAANLGFVVNLNPDSTTTPNPYGCVLDHAIAPSSTKVGQCLSAQVTLNNGAYPQIATAPHGHLAYVTPGGAPANVVRGVDVTKPSAANVILSSTLTAGLVTVTIDTSKCPPPLPNPTSTSNPCLFSMVPGNAGTVLITGVKPGNSANDALFNGNFSVNVTSSNSFTYVVSNSTASDSGSGGCDSTTNVCAEVFYGSPDQTIQITPGLQGVAINPITSTAVMADANSTNLQLDLLNSLDQSVSSIGFSAGCTAYVVPCAPAPELLGTISVAWQPFTNAIVSYNPKLNQVSISDPVSRQRYAFACEIKPAPAPQSCITNPITPADQQNFQSQITLNGTGTATLSVQNGTTGSLTLFGGIAVDAATNQAFVLMSGSGTLDVIDLGGPGTATPLKPTHISEVIVPSPRPGPGVIGGIPNALVPQATLTSAQALSGVRIFGSGFVSGLSVRLDGVDITTKGGTVDHIASNGREVDVTIPASFLPAPHHYALDVISNGSPSNAVDFIVVQQVPLSGVCTDSSGNAVNAQPTSVALADQIANGPFSPFGLISVSGCNSVVKLDLNPASPTFGQQIGSPISVGTTPQGIAISEKLGLAVVANHGTNTVSVLDLTQNPPVQKVPDVTTGTNPTGVAVDDAIGAAVVANTGSNTVSVINLGSLFPPAGTTPPTTLTPTSIGGIQLPIAVAIDPDRGANNQGIAVVTAVSLSSPLGPTGSLDVIEIGFATPVLSTTNASGITSSTPTGIVFDPTVVTGTANPGTFYANSSGTNTITQFNPDTNTGAGSSVSVGVNPTSLAINPQTGAILTSNSASNTISIVDTLSNPLKTHDTLGIPGSATFGVAIDQFTNLAVIVDQANNRVLLFPMPH